jgi:hypothetical protein
MIRAACLCGAVACELDAARARMWFCHCPLCRKETGTAFATWLAVDRAAFGWSGESWLIQLYESSPGFGRDFCGRCGSPVPRRSLAGDAMVVPAGLLDDDPGVRPSAHHHAVSKADWHQIAGVLPRYQGAPAGFDNLTDCGLVLRAPSHRSGASCMCGRIAYELVGAPDTIINCLCSRDRRMSGSAHDSCLHVRVGTVKLIRGRELIRSYKVPGANFFTTQFCAACGAPAPDPDRAVFGDELCMPAGIFDVRLAARARLWIFYASKAPWFEVEDSLPRFDERAPDDFDWRSSG